MFTVEFVFTDGHTFTISYDDDLECFLDAPDEDPAVQDYLEAHPTVELESARVLS